MHHMVSRLKGRSTGGKSVPPGNTTDGPEPETNASVARAVADEDVPRFFCECAEKDPFDYMNVSPRVGPVVIEPGVSK